LYAFVKRTRTSQKISNSTVDVIVQSALSQQGIPGMKIALAKNAKVTRGTE
jgi:hypothetical protein